jgi:hypothetical protein
MTIDIITGYTFGAGYTFSAHCIYRNDRLSGIQSVRYRAEKKTNDVITDQVPD